MNIQIPYSAKFWQREILTDTDSSNIWRTVTVFHCTLVNAKQFDGLNIDGLAGKRQNFPPSKFCAIWYPRIFSITNIHQINEIWLSTAYTGCEVGHSPFCTCSPRAILVISARMDSEINRHIRPSAKSNSRPLANLWPILTFGRTKSILVGKIYCAFSMGQQSITYKMSYYQKTADQFHFTSPGNSYTPI